MLNIKKDYLPYKQNVKHEKQYITGGISSSSDAVSVSESSFVRTQASGQIRFRRLNASASSKLATEDGTAGFLLFSRWTLPCTGRLKFISLRGSAVS